MFYRVFSHGTGLSFFAQNWLFSAHKKSKVVITLLFLDNIPFFAYTQKQLEVRS